MPGDDELYRAEIENRGIEVFFPGIMLPPAIFDFPNNGRFIIFGDIEFFDGQSFLITVKLTVLI